MLDYHKSDEIIGSGRKAARSALRDWKKRRSRLNLSSSTTTSEVVDSRHILPRDNNCSRGSSGEFGGSESVGTFQRRTSTEQRMTTTMSRARSIATLHHQAQRRVPSHLVLSPFPQQNRRHQSSPRLSTSSPRGGGSGGSGSGGSGAAAGDIGSGSGSGGGGKRSSTNVQSSPAGASLSRTQLNDVSFNDKQRRMDGFYDTERSGVMLSPEERRSMRSSSSSSSGLGGEGSDGLRVAHLHSQLTAAASRDRKMSGGARVGGMGGMFTMEEYASTDDDDDMNGEDDDMRNAVMF